MNTQSFVKAIVLAAVFVWALAIPVYGQVTVVMQIESTEMAVDNTIVELSQGTEPKIVNGRALVPLRVVMEALGGIVIWDEEHMLVTIRDYFNENEIILKINSYDSVVNANKGPDLDVAPMLVSGTTMVPISFVSKHLGLGLEWEDTTRTITIYRDAT